MKERARLVVEVNRLQRELTDAQAAATSEARRTRDGALALQLASARNDERCAVLARSSKGTRSPVTILSKSRGPSHGAQTPVCIINGALGFLEHGRARELEEEARRLRDTTAEATQRAAMAEGRLDAMQKAVQRAEERCAQLEMRLRSRAGAAPGEVPADARDEAAPTPPEAGVREAEVCEVHYQGRIMCGSK